MSVASPGVSVEPLRRWLMGRLVAEGVWDARRDDFALPGDRHGRSIQDLADDWGVSVRTIRRVVRGQQSVIGEDRVDGILCAEGCSYLLAEWYG